MENFRKHRDIKLVTTERREMYELYYGYVKLNYGEKVVLYGYR